MAISDAQKVDYLLKKIGYGISKTDTSTNKSPANESVASPLLIRGDGLYAQSDLISVVGTLPASNSSVVTVYRDSLSSAVRTTNDGTAATNRTWKTNLTDWVGPEFGSGYAVKVYTGASLTAATASSGTSLPVDGSGNNDSWFFDYQSGVLNFADTNVPSSIAAQVWVVGARYTGQKGITSLLSASTTGTANVSLYDNVTAYTTNQIFFPQFSNISTTGNTQTGVSSSFGFNPSTGTLSTTIVNAAHNGSIGATTPNTAVFTTATTGGLQAVALGNVTPGTYVFTTGSVGGLQAVAIGNVTAGTGAFTTLTASTWANITGATQSTSSSTGALVVTGGAGIGANLYVGGNTTISGNLTVIGTTTTVQSTTLDVSDLNITVAKGAVSAAAANGAGLTVDGAGATILYTNATDTWNFNKGLVGTTITTGGLQAQAIGNVTPGTYVFTTGSVGGLQAVAIGNVTPGSGAFTTGTFSSTLGVTGATTMTTATTGGLQAVAIGNVTPGTGVFTTGTFNTATTGGLQAVAIGNVTAGTGAFTTLSASTWANITGTTAATSTTTGALVVAGGAGIAGALHVGSTATITGNTAVNNTLYGRGVYDNGVQVVSTSTGAGNLTISTGGINLTPVGPGAVTTGDSVSIPVITTDAYGRITSISTAAVTSVVGAANVAFHTQTVALNNDATFFPTFSNINGGNSIPGTSSLLSYNPGTGNLVSQLGFVSSSQASTSTTSGALQVAGGAGIGGNVHVGGSISATNEITSTKNEEATSTTTGAIRATGGIATQANLFVGKAATFNSSQTAGMDFVVRGKTDTTLIWARPSASYDTVIIGNSAVAGNVVAGAKLNINTTDSILIPVGTNAQRPGNQGQTDVQGMFRYSTTQNAIEWYTGTQWNAATTQFTVITDEQFTGDGSTVAFTMGAAATTASTIVSINGVLQIPTLAYSCSSTTLTFTEAPASSDIIDVRRLTTTTSVTHIDDATGYNAIDVDNTNGVTISTGTAAKNNRYRINTDGAQVSLLANTAVASANTATTIDTMSTTVYRSAKYTIQATNGADYQVLEALLISNGTTATVIAYGTIQTAGNLGIISATQSGSNALLQFVALNASTNVRITKEYLLI